jgi:hypothetical protein
VGLVQVTGGCIKLHSEGSTMFTLHHTNVNEMSVVGGTYLRDEKCILQIFVCGFVWV